MLEKRRCSDRGNLPVSEHLYFNCGEWVLIRSMISGVMV